jgi:hypothetical protein
MLHIGLASALPGRYSANGNMDIYIIKNNIAMGGELLSFMALPRD